MKDMMKQIKQYEIFTKLPLLTGPKEGSDNMGYGTVNVGYGTVNVGYGTHNYESEIFMVSHMQGKENSTKTRFYSISMSICKADKKF